MPQVFVRATPLASSTPTLQALPAHPKGSGSPDRSVSSSISRSGALYPPTATSADHSHSIDDRLDGGGERQDGGALIGCDTRLKYVCRLNGAFVASDVSHLFFMCLILLVNITN
jgi:hypothetical protein